MNNIESNIEFDGLTAENLSALVDLVEATKMLERIRPLAVKIVQNLSDEKLKIFKEQFKPSESPNIVPMTLGLPIYAVDYVPLDEFWFVDKDGKVIKKFRF